MSLLWTYSEQQTIKPIAANFKQPAFVQLQEEVQVEDLQKLLGFQFYQDIIQNPTDTWNAALLNGGTYEVSGVTYSYVGLKFTLAYYLYARYVQVSFKKDTATGFVSKNRDDSRQLNKGDEGNYHKDFRKIAGSYWEENEKFIIANSENFPYYNCDSAPSNCWDATSYRNSFCF